LVLAEPDVELSFKGGRITLDAGRAPHVEASLTIARPSAETLELLDPRETPRVRIDVDATFPTGVQTRTFDLGVRARPLPVTGGEVTLELASDEALLNDYAPLVDDETPLELQDSIRDIVNYALAAAIPGAALEAGEDIPATRFANATNLITDPSNQGDGSIFTAGNCTLDKNDTGWAAHGTRSINIYSPTSTDSQIRVGPQAAGTLAFGVRPGVEYVFSATGRVKATLTGAVGTYARELTVSDAGGVIARSDKIPTTVGVATRVSLRVTIPEGINTIYFRAWHGHTGGEIQWDAFRLTEYTGDPTDVEYFDGGLADTDGYLYEWTGAANASTSTRTAVVDRPPAALVWPAGVSSLTFLQPILQAAGLRLVCDELRRWTLRDEQHRAPGSLAIRQRVNLVDGRDVISRDSGLWFDARVTRYKDHVESFALNEPYTRLTTLDVDAHYPGPGRSEYAVRRAQGRGREVEATIVSDWRTHAEQWAQIILDGAPTQTGITQTVTFDLGPGPTRDEMTVTTRTTDTPDAAWVLIPADEEWIDSPVGESWTDEVI
jgi:hypothetical protein